MTDRSVVVRLKAHVTDFQAGMAAAGKSVDDVQRRIREGDEKTKRNVAEVSRGMLLVGGAAVAAAGVSIAAFAKFDKQMSNVKAVSNATVGEMHDLRAAALEAGKATVFSASESAQAEAELAKAGVGTADILGGALRGSLDLAAAGQLDLADAATISAQSMNIFNLRGKDVAHIADVLAAGANKSAADVKQLGDALRQGGLVSSQLNIGLEDTVGVLSAFADRALIGSDAGTSYKTMLQRLVPQSKEAGDAMESIGFNAFDAQGNFVGLEKVAGGLQQGLGKLSQEQRASTLNTIFGADAVRAANVLYELGADGVRDYTGAVNDQGAATRNAATQLDNLAGDVEQFRGSVETALIQSGSSANTVLRDMTQGATGAVNAFSDLPGPVQGTATAIAGIGGAVLLTLGGIGAVVPKVQSARAALRDLGDAGVKADAGLGRLGRGALKAAGIIGIAAAAYQAAQAAFGKSSDELQRFSETVEAAAGPGTRAQITALNSEIDRLREKSNEGFFNGDTLGGNLGVRLGTDQYQAAQQADFLQDRVKELQHQLKLEGIEAKTAAGGSTELGDALDQVVSPAVQSATDAIDDYKGALDSLNGVNITAARAQIDLTKSFHDAKKAVDDKTGVTNKETLALLDLADQANRTAGAIADQTGSQVKANGALREGRRHFIETAIEMGHTREEARKLADKFLAIPTAVETDISTPGLDHAVGQAEALRRKLLHLDGLSITIPVRLGIANKLPNIPIDGARAAGGPVYPGHLYQVNERGPELFAPAVAGSIVPAGRTAQLLASGGSPLAARSSSDGPLMRDLVVHTHQEGVETVIPRVLDQQMYRMRG